MFEFEGESVSNEFGLFGVAAFGVFVIAVVCAVVFCLCVVGVSCDVEGTL